MDLKHLIPHQRRREFGPALNFQFATDKTLVPRVGPTPTFTRASGATFVNSDGLIQYAPENLLRYSQTFSNSLWVTVTGFATKIGTSTINDPNGGTNAYRINVGSVSGGGSAISQTLTATFQASEVTLSVWARSESGTSVFALQLWTGSARVSSPDFTATTTWTRFTFTTTSIAAQFQIASGSAGGAVGNILVYGAQLERASTAGTYIPTTTGGIHMPRFDHDPVTLVCKGLLMEDQRTNLVRQSADFATLWTASQLNTTAYSNVATAPDGNSNADKLIANTGTSTHQFRQDVTVNGTYTLSCYFKAAETSKVSMALYGTSTGNVDWYSFFDVSNGVITGSRTGFSASSITSVGNGWYRCDARFTTTISGSVNVRIGGANIAGNSPTYAGDNSSGFYIWGAQLESGLHASSYIPTVTGTVARSADTCTLGSFARFCSQIEGTLVVKATTIGSTFVGVVSMIAADRSLCAVNVTRTTATQLRLGVVEGPAYVEAATFNTAVLANAEFKCAVSFKQNDFAGSANGLATQTDTSGVFPSSPLNLMHIGYNGGQRMYGWISSIQYYRQRLPNSSLQALSAIVTNTITYNGVQIQYNSDTNGIQTTN